jgi:CO/xanthine dehydrogenase FAD-binding subunit
MRPRGLGTAVPAFELVAPATEEELWRELGREPGPAVVLAGGTDLLLDLEEGRLEPRRLVSLRRLPWREHRWTDGGLVLGSTEPLSELEADPELARSFPSLAQAVAAVGSPPLRRQATIGGNLGRAAPASDLIPVLLALDAQVDLQGPNGARSVGLDRFLRGSRETALGPSEVVRSVRLVERRPASAYLWQRVRLSNDISQIGVTAAWGPSDGRWRLSLGGVPPRAVLVPEAADRLHGPDPPAAEVADASARLSSHASLVTDRRATDEHRRRLAGALCSRAIAAARGGSP